MQFQWNNRTTHSVYKSMILVKGNPWFGDVDSERILLCLFIHIVATKTLSVLNYHPLTLNQFWGGRWGAYNVFKRSLAPRVHLGVLWGGENNNTYFRNKFSPSKSAIFSVEMEVKFWLPCPQKIDSVFTDGEMWFCWRTLYSGVHTVYCLFQILYCVSFQLWKWISAFIQILEVN